VINGHAPVAVPPASWLRRQPACRVAVLGADGFIGSHVVGAACAAGAEVIGLCVGDPWRLRGLEGHADLRLSGLGGARWWDESFGRVLARLAGRFDALVLLAYSPPASAASEQARLEHERRVNVGGARRLAEAAAAAGAVVVFASSADVYGPWHDAPVGEEVPPRPWTPYAVAKLEAERLVADVLRDVAACVVARIGTVFGPGETGPRAIPSFTRAVRAGEAPVVDGDGRDVRDYVWVADVAAALVNAVGLARAKPGLSTINVGSGAGRTTLEVLQAVATASGQEGARPVHRPRRRPPSRLVLDPGMARRTVGLVPRLDFEAAVAEEVRWLATWSP
jgi:UDP-glucose 4-epimerase